MPLLATVHSYTMCLQIVPFYDLGPHTVGVGNLLRAPDSSSSLTYDSCEDDQDDDDDDHDNHLHVLPPLQAACGCALEDANILVQVLCRREQGNALGM